MTYTGSPPPSAAGPRHREIVALGREATYRLLRSHPSAGAPLYAAAWAGYNSLRALRGERASPLYFSERVVELKWIRRVLLAARASSILEVGDVLGPNLTTFAKRSITVDWYPAHTPCRSGWCELKADSRKLDFLDEFDAAVSISTIEHIGMGHYGDPIDPNGDMKTVSAIHRALRPGGRLFASVPVRTGADSPWQRLYEPTDLNRLLSMFGTVDTEFWHFRRVCWKKVAGDGRVEPATLDGSRPEVLAVALVRATK